MPMFKILVGKKREKFNIFFCNVAILNEYAQYKLCTKRYVHLKNKIISRQSFLAELICCVDVLEIQILVGSVYFLND